MPRFKPSTKAPGHLYYDQIESHAHGVGQRLSQVMQLTRIAEVTADESLGKEEEPTPKKAAAHKPKRLLRTVISSMKKSKQFGHQIKREAKRRRFDEAPRKAFVADGLTCNWTIHAEHFADYVAILDFTHAVSYLFTASVILYGKTDQAWEAYSRWMTQVWRGQVVDVIGELREHQIRIGNPDEKLPAQQPWANEVRRIPPSGSANDECVDGVGSKRDQLPNQGN